MAGGPVGSAPFAWGSSTAPIAWVLLVPDGPVIFWRRHELGSAAWPLSSCWKRRSRWAIGSADRRRRCHRLGCADAGQRRWRLLADAGVMQKPSATHTPDSAQNLTSLNFQNDRRGGDVHRLLDPRRSHLWSIGLQTVLDPRRPHLWSQGEASVDLMNGESRQLRLLGAHVPVLITAAGDHARLRFLEFFAAN